MKDYIIKVNTNTRENTLPRDVAFGVQGENVIQKLVFELDTMIDGIGWVEVKKGNDKGYIQLDKTDRGYEIDIKSSLLTVPVIYVQLRITKSENVNEEIPVFKSKVSYIPIYEQINAIETIPDEYPEWIDIANAKILEIDEALAEVDNLDIDVSKTGTVATVEITKKDGTTESVEINDGTDGADGKDAKINGVNTLTIEAGTNIGLTQEGDTLTIENTYDDSEILSDIADLEENKADKSEIPDVSGFITKDVNNLTYYTKTSDMNTAISDAVGTETTNRQNADNNLQGQIDAITASSDVVDVVSTYSDLENYDTTKLTDKDLIKVMQDSTHSNALSYYRWVVTGGTGSWSYVGSEGPFYTKSETDTLVNAKQNTIDSSHKLSADLVDDTSTENKFVTATDKTNWNNKVSPTDYASSTAGVVKANSNAFQVGNDGFPYAFVLTNQYYEAANNNTFIGKGTLENVIAGKNLETANNKVTSMSSSSTDTQYPSAKAVYNSQKEQDDAIETMQEDLTKKLEKKDAVSMFSNAVYDEITTPSKNFEINSAYSNFGRKLEQDKLEYDLELLGESTQKTTTGKNKLPNTAISQTKAGVTFTINEDKSITINGTATMDMGFNICETGELDLPAGTYILSSQNTIPSSMWFTFRNNGADVIAITNNNSSGDFTLAEASNEARAYIYINNGVTLNNLTIYPMIRLSSVTDSSYEPYTGGNPAPSPDYPSEIESIEAPNLFDELWDGYVSTNFIEVKKGKKYKYSEQGVGSNMIYRFYETTSGNYVENYVAGSDVYIPSQDGYVKLYKTTTSKTRCQLEEGENVTTYRPYGCIGIDSEGENKLNYKTVIASPTGTTVSLIDNGFKVVTTTGGYAGIISLYNLSKNTDYYLQYITENIVGNTKYVRIFKGQTITTEIANFTNGTGGTFNTGDNTDIDIWFYASWGSDAEVNFTNIMLSKGTISKTYTEYIDKHTSIIQLLHPMRSIGTKRDRIYWENGKWYDEQNIGKAVFDGNENWGSTVNSNNYRLSFCYFDFKGIDGYNKSLTNYFMFNWSYGTTFPCFYLDNSGNKGTIYIALPNDTYDTTQKVKDWLSTHNLELYAQLATPIVTEITDTATIEALESIRTYTGVTEITSDILMSGSYVQDINSLYKVYEGFDASKTQVLKNVNGILTWIDE